MRPSDELKRIERILENGWCQGDYHKEETDINGNVSHSYCILGAISQVGPKYPMAVDNYIYSALGKGFTSIGSFNDDPDTTKDDVLFVIKKAITKALKDKQ